VNAIIFGFGYQELGLKEEKYSEENTQKKTFRKNIQKKKSKNFYEL